MAAAPFPQPAAGAGRAFASLPAPLTRLVGRAKDVETLRQTLLRADVRLLTLIGPGGIGKTRLAIEVADAVSVDFADGVVFVPLAPLRAPSLVIPTIAHRLGIGVIGSRPPLELVSEVLLRLELLLVLDNLEHVIEAAPEIAMLLAGCPRLKVLATSREALRISGEHLFPVSPLAVPDPRPVSSAFPTTMRVLGRYEAMELFLERARAVRPDFTLSEQNADAVAAICRHLGGLPLAIELAAARSRFLPPTALLARLDRPLDVLTGGARDLPARHQTMRAAIAWSYDLLPPEEQVLFRRLSVFVGGFTLAAAESVTGEAGEPTAPITHDPSPVTLDGLASLMDKSLLTVADADEGGEPRFEMLEPIREFGAEQLAAHGEEGVGRSRHAAFFLRLAERAEPELWRSEEATWLDRLEREQANLRAAISWAIQQGDAVNALRLCAALWSFWQYRGYMQEGRRWLERALAVPRPTPAAVRAAALDGAAALAIMLGAPTEAIALAQEAVALRHAAGQPAGLARSRHVLGIIWQFQGNHRNATALFAQAVAGYQAASDQTSRTWQALALTQWGASLWALGETEQALAFCEDALTRQRQLDNPLGIALALTYLGDVRGASGASVAAATCYREAFAVLVQHRHRDWNLAYVLIGLVMATAAGGEAVPAVRLAGMAEAIREAAGLAIVPYQQIPYDATIAALKAAVGEPAFAAAWDAGRALDFDQIIAEVTAARSPAAAPSSASPGPTPSHRELTARELDVLRLIAAGQRDREIAAALSISRRTVTTHVAHILAKLDVSSRTAAVAVATRLGLVTCLWVIVSLAAQST